MVVHRRGSGGSSVGLREEKRVRGLERFVYKVCSTNFEFLKPLKGLKLFLVCETFKRFEISNLLTRKVKRGFVCFEISSIV